MSKTSAVTIFFTSRLGLSSLQKLLDCSKKKEKNTINCLWQCIQNPAISLHHVSSQGAGNTKHSKGLFLYLLTSHLENRNKMCFSISSSTGYFLQTDWYFRLLCMYSYGLLLSILLFPQVYFYKTTSVMQTLTYEQQLCERPHFS